jgi:hypothetical protein
MNAEARPMSWPTAHIRGQQSFLLRTRTVELAITSIGGMLGPVTFFPEDSDPIEPYHIAPWAEEVVPDDTPPMLRALRGDFFCSAFGGNEQAFRGKQLPPHGESANRKWQPIAREETRAGCWMQLEVDLPLQGGVCKATTALLNDHSVIYQRHDLTGLQGALNPAHHATLQFPTTEGSGQLSFSPSIHAQTYLKPIDGPRSGDYSCLQPNSLIPDLRRAPTVGGLISDLTRFPARRGFDDVAMLCADPSLAFAWSAVTFPDDGYVWFALRDPKLLASTLLWYSNGGRQFAPWNGRHRQVMGIEDVTAFFHVGIAASCEANILNDRGVRTCLHPDDKGRLSIPYIQGVARIPAGFDRVAAIEPGKGSIYLHSEAGPHVEIDCHLDFLRTGKLPGLDLP